MLNSFNLNDLEISSILGSDYLLSLEESAGERENYKKCQETLARFVKLRSFEEFSMDFFEKHRCKIIVEINKNEKAFLRDMFTRISEDKINKEDKKFIKELCGNILKRGNHYFVILINVMVKLFPYELITGFKDTFRAGKKLANLILDSVKDKGIDEFSELYLTEPFSLGIDRTDITLDSLNDYFNKYGFTASLFADIHRTLIEQFTQRESNDLVSLLQNTEITSLDDMKNFPFEDFFRPSDKTLSALTRVISKKASQIKQQLIKKDREIDRKDISVREETHRLLRENLNKLQSLVDVKKKDLQPILTEIQEHITAQEKALKLHIRQVQELENSAKALKEAIDENKSMLNISVEKLKSFLPSPSPWIIENMVKEYWHGIPFLAIIDPKIEKQIINKVRMEYRASENENIFKPLDSEERRGFYPDVDNIISKYKTIFRDILEPIYLRNIIDSMIEIWPPEVDFENPKSRITGDDKIHLVGIDLLPSGYFYRFSKKGKIEPNVETEVVKRRQELSTILRQSFSSLATTLVYDIRGSTFMSHRLRDAEKEHAILSKFQSTIFDAARNGSSFILKDTGDGGILWFGANSREVYRKIYKYNDGDKGKLLRYSTALEDEFELKPHPSSAELAISTAINLVNAAEDFVRENYMKYRDWFEEVTEKEVFHNGITYALLPPKFKSLFRMGIGIASGMPGKDVVFTPNAFGDPDLTGILVDESTLYSSGRSPERSVIIADHCTIINLILNSERFLLTEPLTTQDTEQDIIDKLLGILKRGNAEEPIIFDNFTVSSVGVYHIDRKEKDRCMDFNLPKGLNLQFNDRRELTDGNSRIKLLYEILPREKDEE